MYFLFNQADLRLIKRVALLDILQVLNLWNLNGFVSLACPVPQPALGDLVLNDTMMWYDMILYMIWYDDI